MSSGGAPDDPPSAAPVLTRTLTIRNRRGLHARAAAKFVATRRALRRRGRGGEGWAGGLRPLHHGADDAGRRQGSAIEMRAEGWDAKEAMDALAALVEVRLR